MKISAFGHCWVLRWPWVLAVLAVAAVPAGLSVRQWQRGEDKLATLARIAQWEREGAVGLARLAALAGGDGRAAAGGRPERAATLSAASRASGSRAWRLLNASSASAFLPCRSRAWPSPR